MVVEVVPTCTLHCVGYDSKPGTVSASAQSTLNSLTQSTHATRSWRLLMGPPQLEPPGTVTEGQVPTKPICAGVKSPAPSQARSEPPQRRRSHPSPSPAPAGCARQRCRHPASDIVRMEPLETRVPALLQGLRLGFDEF